MTRARELAEFAATYDSFGTPSPWGGQFKAFQVGINGFGGGLVAGSGGLFSNNLYYDGADWRYILDGAGSVVYQDDGEMFVYTAASGSAGAVASLGVPKLKVTNTGAVQVISPNGSLGYGTGSGGTVTQATSKSTSVTLNKPTGQITMNSAALAAGAEVTFSVVNSLCGINDTVVVNTTNTFNYTATCQGAGVGAFAIRVKNQTGGSLSEAVLINFAIIKGATA